MPLARIRVFWDLESCPPPLSYPGSHWDLIKSVRQFTGRLGVIVAIKAYWDHNQTQNPREGNVSQLRAAMPSMGINLVDCGLMENYSRESLARTLIVDFMLSAIDDPVDIDKPGQDIIMIFSGNKSILHPISLLMFRGYTVVLVVPDEVKGIEASRATRVFNWQADVLGLGHDQGLESVFVSSAEHSRHRGLSLNEAQAQNIDMEESGPVPSSHSLSSIAPQVSPQTSLSSGTLSSMMSPYQHRSTVPLHPISPKPFDTAVPPVATPKIKPKYIPHEPFGSPGPRAPSALSLHFENAASWNGYDALGSKVGSSDIQAQMLGQISPMPSQGQTRDTNNGQGIGNSWDPVSSRRPPKPTAGLQPGLSQLTSDISTTSNITQPHSESQLHGSGVTQLKTEPKEEPPRVRSEHEPRLESSEAGNHAFEPLLQYLRRAKVDGKTRVLRSQLGAVFNKDKEIYLAAGVISFSGYIALAVQKGLVDIGGSSGRDWVSLKS